MEPRRCILTDLSPASWDLPNGGQHRTCQLREIITGGGIELRAAPRDVPCSNFRKYALGVKFLARIGLRHGGRWRYLRRHGAVAAWLATALREHDGAKVLLWEETWPDRAATVLLAREAGFAVLAAPHNLETLVPRSAVLRPAGVGRRFRDEVRILSAANAVFCCAREEQWLLALHGLNADFLPCYPTREVGAFCTTIRERRQSARPERWLILGSAHYAPTYQGIRHLIETLRNSPQGATFPVDIAGFGTEALQGAVSGTGFRVHGGVSQAALGDLLTSAKAVLIHQVAGAGALTRIPETIWAGVPVIANPIAARSMQEHEGVYVYDSDAELFELLQRNLPSPPPPARPVAAERRFLKTLERLIEPV